MASYLQIFSTFAKIGAFTIGGGYAMIPLVRDEIVKKGWLEEKDFPDIVALSQSAPGLLAVNISIFVGYRLKGTKGSIVATLGSVAPPFLIILIIAMAFTGFQDNPVVVRIFKGIRPVVVALIAVPMLQMARQANKKWWMWGILSGKIPGQQEKGGQEMIFIQLFTTFFIIGLFTIGGGYAMLSLIQAQVVSVHGWIDEQTFTDIVAISQMTPGPIGINSATYIGYSVLEQTGAPEFICILGSFTASMAVVLPSFILVLGICKMYNKFQNNRTMEGVLTGLKPTVAGLIGAAAVILITPENFPDWKSWVLFAAAFLASWWWKASPIITIIAGGVLGLILY